MEQTVNNVLGQVSQLPLHLTQWRQDTDEYLADLIPKKGRFSVPRSLLELAATFFRCFACTEPISYPRILMHSCFLRPSGAKAGAGTKTQECITTTSFDECYWCKYHFSLIFGSVRGGNASRQRWSFLLSGGLHIRVSSQNNPGLRRESRYHYQHRNGSIGLQSGMSTLQFKQKRQACHALDYSGKMKLPIYHYSRCYLTFVLDLNKNGSENRAPWRLVDSAQDLEKVEQEEKKVANNSSIPTQYVCHLCDDEVQDRVTHLKELYVTLFLSLPFLWNLGLIILSCRHLWGGHETNMLDQFYKDIDLTMALPPPAVKIWTPLGRSFFWKNDPKFGSNQGKVGKTEVVCFNLFTLNVA